MGDRVLLSPGSPEAVIGLKSVFKAVWKESPAHIAKVWSIIAPFPTDKKQRMFKKFTALLATAFKICSLRRCQQLYVVKKAAERCVRCWQLGS
jgi:hypothetical protein